MSKANTQTMIDACAALKPKHTPGPWAINRTANGRPQSIAAPKGSICSFNAQLWDRDPHRASANAARIVECVNALEGYKPAALWAVLDAASIVADPSKAPEVTEPIENLRACLAALGVK